MPVGAWIAIFVALYIVIFLPLMQRANEEKRKDNASER